MKYRYRQDSGIKRSICKIKQYTERRKQNKRKNEIRKICSEKIEEKSKKKDQEEKIKEKRKKRLKT